MFNARELRNRRATILDQARTLVETAEAADRDLSEEERGQYDGLIQQAGELEQRIARMESLPEGAGDSGNGNGNGASRRQAPAFNRLSRGDDEAKAMAHWLRTGDTGGVRSMTSTPEDEDERRSRGPVVEVRIPKQIESRAAKDELMNETTAADGGALVPTGFVNTVATRRNEIRLSNRLGVRMIPGNGKTVDVPYENADPEDFAATSEQVDAHSNTYERDAATFATKAFTLAKKTKKLELTEELLDDEDANVMAFIGDVIGRSIASTHNAMLLTEVAANGTALKTFASATAIAAGEPEDLVFHDTLSYYMDDAGTFAWVMRPTTLGAIKGLTGDARQYGEQTLGSTPMKTLVEYPVLYSNKASAIGATYKSVYFGNWNFVGMREDPALRLIRDPYTVDGIILLKYTFRAVYGVLIAGAVGYGVHPSA